MSLEILKDYALRFVGVPYKWGGAHPCNGLDCSGLVQIILKAAGEDPPGDQTAQGIYNHFAAAGKAQDYLNIGTLLFFGQSVLKITHVAWALNPYQMIEAGGGGSKTLTVTDAIRDEAFVRVSLINSRNDLVSYLKPYYRKIGHL